MLKHHFDAFISYNHNPVDSLLAGAVKSLLEQYAKPWYSWRAARVFRDVSSLESTPELWPTIKANLDVSRHFVLIASQAASHSPWVKRELCYWLTGGLDVAPDDFTSEMVKADRLTRFHLIVGSGTWYWQHSKEGSSDFDWDSTTSLPSVLKRVFGHEPNIADVRKVVVQALKPPHRRLDRDNAEFVNEMAKVLAPIREQDIETLTSQDYREHRRALRVFRALSAGLAVAFLIAIGGGAVAWHQRSIAMVRERESRHEQGIAWLARSAASERAKDFLSAKLMAMKAVNYLGYCSSAAVEDDLLTVDSHEHREALSRIARMPECNIVYAARVAATAPIGVAQCAFTGDGEEAAVLTHDGSRLGVSTLSGKIVRSEHPLRDLPRIAMEMGLDRPLGPPNELLLADSLFLRIEIRDQSAGAKWIGSDDEVSEIPIPQVALRHSSNDITPELVGLVRSRRSPLAVAMFQNSYVKSIVAITPSVAHVVHSAEGEISDDSGIVRSIDACVSDDGTLIIVSESNRKDNSSNTLVVCRSSANAHYAVWKKIVVDDDPVLNLTLSPHNRFVAGTSNNEVLIWDVETGRLILRLSAHRSHVIDVVFDRDERSVASISTDGSFLVWSLPSPDHAIIDLSDAPQSVRSEIGVVRSIRGDGDDDTSGDKITRTSPYDDLLACWESYAAPVDQGDENRYGWLSVSDIATEVEILKVVINDDAKQYDSLHFTKDGRHVVASKDSRLSMFCLSRPRHHVDYKSAYAGFEFTDRGLVIRKSLPTDGNGRLPVPTNVSWLYFSEMCAAKDVSSVKQWYFQGDSGGTTAWHQ